MTLSTAHQRFVDEYINNPSNASEAARRAGYSSKRARVTACELIQHPKIAEAITRQRTQIREHLNYQTETATKDLLAIINEPGAKVRDRIAAIRLLAQILGLYPK